jgi:hypothetical protein
MMRQLQDMSGGRDGEAQAQAHPESEQREESSGTKVPHLSKIPVTIVTGFLGSGGAHDTLFLVRDFGV